MAGFLQASRLIGPIVLFCGVLVIQIGCQKTNLQAEESRLSKLAIFYGRYIGQNKGQPPANEKSLKEFIAKIDADVNLDDLFVSPRDNEPYVVLYRSRPSKPGAVVVSAHEKTGVSGKKMVSLETGQVREVDETELTKLLAGSR